MTISLLDDNGKPFSPDQQIVFDPRYDIQGGVATVLFTLTFKGGPKDGQTVVFRTGGVDADVAGGNLHTVATSNPAPANKPLKKKRKK